MDDLSDPIVDTITNTLSNETTTPPFMGLEFHSTSSLKLMNPNNMMMAKNNNISKLHVDSVEEGISVVNEFGLDFLLMDISVHHQQQQNLQNKASRTSNTPNNNNTATLQSSNVPNSSTSHLLDLRQICQKHNVSSRQYLFRTTDWSHCMVGKVDEAAFQAAFGIYSPTNKKLLCSDKPYDVPGLDEYSASGTIPSSSTPLDNTSSKKTSSSKQNKQQLAPFAIPSTAGTLSQIHIQAQAAKLILQQELQWATHLCIPAVLFPEPQNKEMAMALAQFINLILPTMGNTAIWIRFSANNYYLWNLVRTMCNSHTLLIPVLDLKNKDVEELILSLKQSSQQHGESDKKKKKTNTGVTPEQYAPQDTLWNAFEKQTFGAENSTVTSLSVWIAENVRTIILNLDLFSRPVNNATPFLHDEVAQFLAKTFKYDIQFVLSAAGFENEPSPNMTLYKRTIASLFETSCMLTNVEVFSKSFRDFLQRPLQPLIDNLDSQTYEVFERDPIKYMLYEKSAEKALLDLYEAKKKKAPSEEDIKTIRVIAMVLGAGRGPIVKAVLRAARTTKVPVLVYAVEKNPNALSHLLYYKKTIWRTFTQAHAGENLEIPIVEIIQKDMRVWNPPEKADLLVSELLGSFGDNELSPECLDGAQRLLKENGEGISIPARYTSYLSPLCSYKVWSEVKNLQKSTVFEAPAFETGYVCLVHRGVVLDKPQRCFTFIHPNPQVTEALKEKENALDDTNETYNLHIPLVNNDRYVSLRFKSQQNAVVHGLIGYFECQLYKDVWMSILPETFSSGMFSWFPIFFPVETPVIVKKGEDIGVQMWRNCDHDVTRKVWYEWCVTTNSTCSKIHNSHGKHYYISL
ncbi:hypothetical protein C9374_013171 [Naegleria lovaniensis]|uniref:Protein arginine N-methyltransferase n=1 Tax=Naegleria lovaniensis TaxID=51637 RepID=A0AA88GBX6_NAELO|nr:uncharacterized protein C9374_013171 [Naegleria lovaniensis]KAG2372807.1 hypothetical protein C9374_013171 [Naegleria lovaniensis]